jgi:tetratricopeptide (TPR) repeat protein
MRSDSCFAERACQALTFLLSATIGFPASLAAQAIRAGQCANREPAAPFTKAAEDVGRSIDARVAAYQKAIQLCPHEPWLYTSLSTLLVKAQRPQDAINWSRLGLSRWPQNEDLARNLGVALLTQGDAQGALKVLQKLPPSAQTDFQLGMAHRGLGHHELARIELIAAYTGGQKDPYILYTVIQEDRALGDRAAGLKHFTTLDHDFPESGWVHLLMGDAYADRHDPSGAAREYQAAASVQPLMPIVHFNLGRLAFDRGDYASAENEFRQELRVNPTFGEAHLYLGETLTRRSRNVQAVAELKMAISYSPNSSLAYQALASAEDATGDSEAAVATLQAGQQRFPQDPAFPGQLARILRRQGKLAEAGKEAVLAQSLSSQNNPAIGPGRASQPPRAAAAGSVSGEGTSAANPLTHAFERISNPGIEEMVGHGRPSASALASASAAVKRDPNNASGWLALGRLQLAATDQVSAVHSFLRAQKLQPNSALPVYSIGMSFFLLGIDSNSDEYYARAERHFRAALELDPRYDRAVFMLGVIYVLRSKMTDACSYLESAIALNTTNPYYHLQYGILLGRLGKAGKAIAEMTEAEQLDPSNPQGHFSLGELYARQRDFNAARLELEKAVQLDPHLASGYYTLGSVYHHLGLEAESQRAYASFQQEKSTASEEQSDRIGSAIKGQGDPGTQR